MSKFNLERITKRSEDFDQWYTDVVKQSKIMQYGIVKGTMSLTPYGLKIWNLIKEYLNLEFKNIGVEEVVLPTLFPLSSLQKEKDNIKSFAPELFTVTEIKGKKLQDPLVLRPTSEIAFENYFKNSIQSYKELPIMINQWVNVFRMENNTRPFLRNSEFLWQEGHTAHVSEFKSEEFALKILSIYKNLISEKLLIANYSGLKTESEKFPAAKETYTIEAIMQNGYALQSATSHNLSDNFSKIYDVNFFDKDNKKKNIYQTSWGCSTRLIGSIIMAHSDDNGLVLPPFAAPVQIQILEIHPNKNSDISNWTKKIKSELENKYRVEIDNTDLSFGKKAALSEIKGIPIRVEIGPNSIKDGKATIFRRDNFEKVEIKLSKVSGYIENLVIDIEKSMKNKSQKNLQNKTIRVKNFSEFEKEFKNNNIFVETDFLIDAKVEKLIKDKFGVTPRLILERKPINKKCFYSQKTANATVIWARAY